MINITNMCQVTYTTIYDYSNINPNGECIPNTYTEIEVSGNYDFNNLIFNNSDNNFVLDDNELSLIELNGHGRAKFRVIGEIK